MIVYFEAKQPTRVADKNIFSSDLRRVELQSVFRRTKTTGAKLFRGYHSQFTLNYRRSTQYECSVKYVQYSGTQSFHVEVKSIHAVRY